MTDNLADAFVPFEFRPSLTSRRAHRLPIDQWTKHQQTIAHLYIQQDKTLDEVVDYMKQFHDFHATPRQYTQKFKSWRLHKNKRHSTERKPRLRPSVYERAPVATKGAHLPTTGLADRCAARDFIDVDQSDPRHVNKYAQTVRTFANQMPTTVSGTDTAAEHRSSGSCNWLDGATESSAIIIDDDDNQMLSNDNTPMSSPGSFNGLSTSVVPTHTGTNTEEQHPRPIEGPQTLWGTLEEETLKKLEPMKKDLTKQITLAMAMWRYWHSGETIGFDLLFDDVELNHSRGLEWNTLYGTSKVLHQEWLAFYPCNSSPEVRTQGHGPSSQAPDAPIRRWASYADRGYMVASLKTRMNPDFSQAYARIAASKLAEDMGQVPNKRRRLRQGFEIILTCLQLHLRDQYNHLKPFCRKFAKYFTLHLSEPEERKLTGRSCQTESAAILAMVCHEELKSRGIHTSRAFREMSVLVTSDSMFSVERVFVWAARLVLFYASQDLRASPLPSDLCARALSGCGRVLKMVKSPLSQHSQGLSPGSSQEPVSDVEHDVRFARLWAEWICYDGHFFFDEASTEPSEEH